MPTQIVKGFNVSGETLKYDYKALENNTDIANEYDATLIYKIGDYVHFSGQLYECIEEILSPENFDNTKWKNINVTDEITLNKKYIDSITDVVGLKKDMTSSIELIDGKRVNSTNGNITDDTYDLFSASGFIDCKGFNKIKISMPIININAYFGLCFYSSNSSSTKIVGYRCQYVEGGELGVDIRDFDVPLNANYFATTWFTEDIVEENNFEFSCEFINKEGTLISTIDSEIIKEMDPRDQKIEDKILELQQRTGLNTSIHPIFSANPIKSNGDIGSDVNYQHTDYISCENYNYMDITLPVFTSNLGFGICFYNSNKELLKYIKCKNDTSLEADTYNQNRIYLSNTYKTFRTTWFASSSDNYDNFSCTLFKEGELPESIEFMSDNILDVSKLIHGYYVVTNNSQGKGGTLGSDESKACTDYIKVTEGEILKISSKRTQSGDMTMYNVVAFNSNHEFIDGLYDSGVSSYIVPNGVKFVRITVREVDLDYPCVMIRKDNKVEPYVDSYNGPILPSHNYVFNSAQAKKYYPYSSLPDYFINLLTYRPLGVLDKPYICLISDDGYSYVSDYAIPMLESKGVPATFAVMKTSSVWSDNTKKQVLIDAVNNYGCSIAQHADFEFTSKDELTLSKFFDAEEAFFDSMGLTVKGAVCPRHFTSPLIQAMCGARFNVVRTGDQIEGIIQDYGGLCSPRSNIFALPSRNVLASNLVTIKQILDYAYTNNRLRIMHWHDGDFDINYPRQDPLTQQEIDERKQRFEDTIDYAISKGFKFITLDQIPKITYEYD